MNKGNSKIKVLEIVVFVILCINMIIALFGVLQVPSVNPTDEACHGINAYEMIRNGDIWVNTLKYNVDYYNSKPPLMLWLIMIGYKIYGFTPMGLRIASAICGLILFWVVSFFVYKKRDGLTALLFASFLPACTLLFNYHMMRSGDMDSLYVLCFTLAMIGLIMAYQNLWWLILYGLGFGLAFMAKSTHAALIIIIGILCLPFLFKAGIRIKHIAMSALAAVIVILPWFIQRVRFDGLHFFKVMVLGQTIANAKGSMKNASSSEYYRYIVQLLKEPICDIAFAIIIVSVCVKYFYWKKENVNNKRIVSFAKNLISYRRYVLIMWFAVVIIAFSIAKGQNEWYTYSSYISLIMMASECGAFLVKVLYTEKKKTASWIVASLIIFSALFISINNISKYPWNGTGGDPQVNFSKDLSALLENTELELSTKNAYIETSFNDYRPQNCWELDSVFYCETILDMRCVDGGAPEFLATDDMDALLFLDKSLWDQYSDVLTGYVILQDNNYLIFSKHKYGE